MDLSKVATGEMWMADEALESGLVDHMGTMGDTLETLND
jgi:ClpP class serine protease